MSFSDFEIEVADGTAVARQVCPPRTRETFSDLGRQLQHLTPFGLLLPSGQLRFAKLVITDAQVERFERDYGFNILQSPEVLAQLLARDSWRLTPVLKSGGNELVVT
jgi:hypothetical protein